MENSTEINSTSTGADGVVDVNTRVIDAIAASYMQLEYEVERLIFVVTTPPLVVFGSFGNILTFIVMRTASLKDVSTCFYMSILALADTGMLVCGIFPAWIGELTKWETVHHVWTDCKLSNFCWFFFRHYSSALLAIMSFEKFIALYLPLKVRSICTVKTAKWVSGIAFLLFALYDAQFFFTAKRDEIIEVLCIFEEIFENYWFTVNRIDGILYTWAPFAIMGVANIAIIYKFIRAKLASKRGGTESTNQAMSSAVMRGTAILITVSATFIVLTGPYSIYYAMSPYPPPSIVALLSLVVLNHSINSVLYCIVGTKFRKEFIAKLCWFRRRNVDNRDFSGLSMKTSVSVIASSENVAAKTASP